MFVLEQIGPNNVIVQEKYPSGSLLQLHFCALSKLTSCQSLKKLICGLLVSQGTKVHSLLI